MYVKMPCALIFCGIKTCRHFLYLYRVAFDFKYSIDRQVEELRERERERRKTKRERKVKHPGVCQQHVTGVADHYSARLYVQHLPFTPYLSLHLK